MEARSMKRAIVGRRVVGLVGGCFGMRRARCIAKDVGPAGSGRRDGESEGEGLWGWQLRTNAEIWLMSC